MFDKLKNDFKEVIRLVITAAIIAIPVLAITTVSWVTVCGIIKIITLLIGVVFDWGIASTIWGILYLLTCAFYVITSDNEDL